jgi:fructokinase
MRRKMPLYGGIEAGGTKWICAVGTGPGDLRATTRFSTTTPDDTIGRAIAFFKDPPSVAAIGVGSFGPIDAHQGSPTFGYITTTPKTGWRNTDLAGPIRQALGVPVGFDTDVNAAALGEWRWGAAQGLDTLVYLTIGTGIGGGVIAAGNLLHGMLHPEIGHMRIPHDLARDPFPGSCPYHGDCLEGLAAGPALAARWGERGERLPPEHPAWELQAHYLGLALSNLVCTLSPQRIVLGGGVMHQPGLIERIRQEVQALLNGYIQAPQIEHSIDSYIVLPGLGDQSGVLGAIALAQQATS